jgi:hypothetical protein
VLICVPCYHSFNRPGYLPGSKFSTLHRKQTKYNVVDLFQFPFLLSILIQTHKSRVVACEAYVILFLFYQLCRLAEVLCLNKVLMKHRVFSKMYTFLTMVYQFVTAVDISIVLSSMKIRRFGDLIITRQNSPHEDGNRIQSPKHNVL